MQEQDIPEYLPKTWEPPQSLAQLLSGIPSRPIFHYTSQQGLLGVLKDKALWATNILYLNDAAEFQYTLDLVESRLKERDWGPTLGDVSQFCENVINWLKGSMKYPSLFVASFSERGDLLSQWRAYCTEGIGFSIGFTYDQLKPAIAKEHPNARILQCVYEKEKQLEIVDELITRAVSQINKKHLKDSSEVIASLLMFEISNLAPAFKHPAFEEEQEWRIVIGPGVSPWHDVSFRPGKSMLIPYCNFSLCGESDLLLIQKIYAGPNPHGLLSGLSAINSLTRHNAHSVEGVQQSSIPFRSW